MVDNINDVPGIRAGHFSCEDVLTGCTVILAPEEGAVAGMDLRGGAPGTREMGLLAPDMLVERVHAIYLGGGSAWGLEAAGGIMEYLAEKDIGFQAGGGPVPIVPGAIIYDLELGERAWPDREMARRACENAEKGLWDEGSSGAGTGATVGKAAGKEMMMKGGCGSAAVTLPGGGVVGGLAVVNTLGEVRDPDTGRIIAGIWDGKKFLKTRDLFLAAQEKASFGNNTLLGVIATDCRLTPAQATRVAKMAHDGIARTVYPAHTMHDGDIIFVLSTGEKKANLNTLGMVAAEVMAASILRGVREAKGAGGVPACCDISPE